MYGVISEGVSLPIFLFVFTLRIDALVFIKFLSVDFQVNPGTTVRAKHGKMLPMLYWKPLMVTNLAFMFLHFSTFARQGYGGIGLYVSVRSTTFGTSDIL